METAGAGPLHQQTPGNHRFEMAPPRNSTISIAFFHRGHIFGGAEESLLFNALDLRRRGHEVSVLCLDAFHVADGFRKGDLSVHRRDVWSEVAVQRPSFLKRLADSMECRSKRWAGPLAKTLPRLVTGRQLRVFASALREIRPSVVIGNMNAGGDHQFLRLAHKLGTRTVSHQRITPPVWVGRRLLDDVNRFCDGLISNSEWTRSRWIQHGMRADRHEVIYNTLPPVEPSSENLRARAGLDDDARVLVSVGRLSVEKSFESGIRAFASVARDFPAWHYIIIGEGAERERLQQVSRDLDVFGRVHLVGSLPGASAYLHQADVFLHPTPAEHFGRVVAEAMLARTVVLAHGSGGVPEMIREGCSGFLFLDNKSLETKLREVMSSPVDEAMLTCARARIIELCGMANAEALDRFVQAAAAGRIGGNSGR